MGTFYSKVEIDNVDRFRWKQGYRNVPPFSMVSAYRLDDNQASNYDARTINALNFTEAVFPGLTADVTNSLHKKFGNKLGESSSFGATLTAELNQTVDLVGGTVLRLVSAARHVKRLDFSSAARTLGLPYVERTRVTRRSTQHVGRNGSYTRYHTVRTRVFRLPSGREVQKTLANGWLLWSYGVKPLASDIYNALDILQRPLDYKQKVFVTSRSGKGRHDFYDGGTYRVVDDYSAAVRGACSALVSVSNPNYYLLNKLGLANPLQWVNEAIPLSFVADWFSNLSQVIGQFNEYLGYSIENPCLSMHFDITRNQSIFFNDGTSQSYRYTGKTFRRTPGLPTPTLVFAYERFQPQRALNAIALLVGLLPHK